MAQRHVMKESNAYKLHGVAAPLFQTAEPPLLQDTATSGTPPCAKKEECHFFPSKDCRYDSEATEASQTPHNVELNINSSSGKVFVYN